MRYALTVLALGASLASARALSNLAPAPAAAVTLTVAVALAALCSEGFSPLGVAVAAAGALGFTALAPHSLPLAGAALLASAYLPRALRARTPSLRGAHALAALAAGGAGTALAMQYADAELAVRGAALLVAGLLAALPLLLPADDAVAHALAGLAREAPEPTRTFLLRAAFLRRRVGASPEALSDRAATRLERAWAVLVDAAAARAARPQAVTGALVDARIRAHVDALERIYTAAEERLARAAGLDDGALREAALVGEGLEAEVSALTELARAPEAPSLEPAPAASTADLATATPAPAQPAPATPATEPAAALS